MHQPTLATSGIESAVLALDIGNTHTRFAVLHQQRILWRKEMATQVWRRRSEARKIVRQLSAELQAKFGKIRRIGVASVVPAVSEFLQPQLMQKLQAPVLSISAHLKLPFKIRYKTPETLGADRIALTAFAKKRFPEHTVIAIDFGTAITFDIVRASSVYLGGMIVAGMHTAATALVNRAAQLPAFEISKVPKLIGQSTLECLQAGAFWGTVAQTEGLIARLKAHLQHTYNESNAIVLATGGDAAQLAEVVKAIDVVEKDAVLLGIETIVEGNAQ